LEIILKAVYHDIMGSSTSPEIEMFKEFRAQWQAIDQSSYDLPENYPAILSSQRRAEIIAFAEAKINVSIILFNHITGLCRYIVK